ncbi:capZ-interacting protein isoform X2 [Mastacembelus armatus]|uniref:capZ-interacting protein isoform X2 n=1 Tax=Mastacembelus armatus TaxID=205130 RepID=UPI000E45A2D8|nr:capZ-interacting protein-like isoform X2 [Mastacembelus armatus]
MEDSPSKPSVAELAGKFKILPISGSNGQKTAVFPNALKNKMKNSPIFEKLQANLALSPTVLLPPPKSAEVKQQPAPLSPNMPCGTLSPLSPTLHPSQLSGEEEDPISFDSPPEGARLPSINKTRARLSFKRRPPTRQHRRSAGEEAGASCELYSPEENGDQDEIFDSPAEEVKYSQLCSLEEAEDKDRDCEKTEDELIISAQDKMGDPEEEQAQTQSTEALEEEQQNSESCPVEQTGSNVKTEEDLGEMPQEAHQRGNDGV